MSMIPEEHHQVTGRCDADRCDRDVPVRDFVGCKGERTVAAPAMRPRGFCGEKADVRGHHQQPVHESKRAAIRVAPPFTEEIPGPGDGVRAEEPNDPGADESMCAALPAGI